MATKGIDDWDSILVEYRNIWFPKTFFRNDEQFKKLSNFQINDGDILVATYPKSGTTWMQAIVLLIMSKEEGSGLGRGILDNTFPQLDHNYPGIDVIRILASPRFIKTHLPFDFLPVDVINGKGKVIYIARNVKDVLVSYHYMMQMIKPLCNKTSIEQHFSNFVSGQVVYGPWEKHVLGYWQRRYNPNLLFVTYEDMHTDLAEMVQQVAEFLDHPLSKERIAEIVRLTSFEEMKNNPHVNYSWWNYRGIKNKTGTEFMRKGKVGDWRNHLTEAMSAELEAKCLLPLKDVGLVFLDENSIEPQ